MSGANYIASNWRIPENSNSSKNDNYSLSFDPSGDYLTFPSAGDLFGDNEKFSFSFWCKVETMAAYKVFFDFSPNNFGLLALRTISTNTIELLKSGSSLGTHTFSDTTDFHHFCIVYDKTNIKLFIDTAEVISSAQTNMGNFTGLDLYLGNGYFLTSGIDATFSEASIFNYDLSSPQINTLYGDATSGAGNPMALKPTPVAYYPLGDNSSGGIDLVGPTSILTQPNVSVDDASVFDFDPSASNYINMGNPTELQITGELSISAWVKFTGNDMAIVTKANSSGANRSFQLYGDRAGTTHRPVFVIWNSGTFYSTPDTGARVDDGNWHHLLATFKPSTYLRLYIDGQLEQENTTSIPASIDNDVVDFNIGRAANGTFLYDGEISNVVIWNSDQSSEKDNIYNDGIPATSYTNTPIAWWKLDQSANWEADTSGNWQIPDAVSAYPQSFNFVRKTSAVNGRAYLGSGSLTFNDKISASIWVRVDLSAASNYQLLFAQTDGTNNSWSIGLNSGNEIWYRIWNADGSLNQDTNFSGTDIKDGKWHHVVLVYDGTSNANGIKLFLDGKLEAQLTASSTGIDAQPLKIALANSSLTTQNFPAFNVGLANAQVWNTDLSYGTVTTKGDVAGGDIATLYNNGTPLTTAIQSANLKGWWKLDDTATFSTNWTFPDASGNGNTGTSSGMTEQSLVNNNVSTLNGESSGMTSGNLVLSDLTRNLPYENYSMAFDGTEYIETASTFSLLDGQTSATFSMWIKPTAVNIFQYLFSIVRSAINTQFQVACHLDDLARIRVYGDTTSKYTYSNTGVVSAGVWTHLCITFDLSQPVVADRVVIYVNGVDETNAGFRNMGITQFQTSTSGFSIARNQNNNLPEFEGLLSQFSVFNSTLTSTEVLKLYANGLPQDLTNFTPQPDSWWTLGKESFWNGSDWIVRDMISSNDGTSSNMAVSDLIGDAPRSEANGTGTNMDIPTNLVGNAGFSDNNAYSINMSPSARVTDTP